ncbi:alcohol dehydrogenase [Kosakonia radicincitans DSM 16656]|uniref:quinone oxidoreductase family protein n=1 Tax=Kosakonia radicincitans TaxID=283686 RepID=UPI000272EDF9|nr:zinc-binding alcohol dehydrogenase family protein [Kosakonia radicincitans]ARD60612.1 alcohol dehydrogenase [Kosakonia radicincitans DSM 16656]KDE37943.1 alcohol dehydrogenase [Kosakonia radicincitans UMEnt01/12]
MYAAIVHQTNQPPSYASFAMPEARQGECLITVNAAAISHVVKSRASGQHYSFDGALPFVPGIDGVGTRPDGQRVWFAFPRAPWGSMAEFAPVAEQHCIPLVDGLDSISAAAMANPGMSAWAALVSRAGLRRGETVLINGATGSAGQLAVQIARYLGAGKIIVTGRNAAVLHSLGADHAINLTDESEALRQQFAGAFATPVDVVVDYLWGSSAELILTAAAKAKSPTRFVQVGALSGQDIRLSGAWLRAAPIQLMGSGIGSLSLPQLLQATAEMFAVALPAQLRIATTPAPLSDVETAWLRDDSQKRTVFVIS